MPSRSVIVEEHQVDGTVEPAHGRERRPLDDLDAVGVR